MELRDFVDETLRQILEGLEKSQGGRLGSAVNAASTGGGAGGNLFSSGTYGMFTRVDFDVAVSAETSSGGKASLKVFNFGVEGDSTGKHTTASRVSFSVPVRLPDGDQSARDRENAALAKGNAENADRAAERRASVAKTIV